MRWLGFDKAHIASRWGDIGECNGATLQLVRDTDQATIVYVNRSRHKTILDAASTCTHEAVHCWQIFRDYIHEDKPSVEFEAYGIETISNTLIKAYKEGLTRGKKKVRK